MKSLFLKSLIVAVPLSFYACGTPTTENTSADTEIQQVVNAEANTEQENLDYAEKQEATNQAIELYRLQKEGLYENTLALVDKENYPNFSDKEWLALLKKEEESKGAIEKYAVQTVELETLADGTKAVQLTVDVTRNGKKYKEEVELIKMDNQTSYLLKEIEFESEQAATEEDDD
ncbi:hypothetical protein [Bernardetia sp.]|uniref:hypothetical protein n=1 Tax=Bernardetia sp. TaxID=1937974 RepID=UPI0025BEC1D6|nr:hypothetical protein [Bernardetia sp.]